jgi:DNA-binding transcriptional regulator/RsmH inhibitor MraZ
VSSAVQPYRGFNLYKMDPKYRVSIKADWRPEPGETLFLLFSRTREMPMIKVLTQAGYDERVQIVEKSQLSEAKKREKLGSLAMLCREVTLNEQGKLLVPKDLSEKAGLEADSDVMLAGREKHFEIWNKENFDRFLELEMNQDDDDELGIL